MKTKLYRIVCEELQPESPFSTTETLSEDKVTCSVEGEETVPGDTGLGGKKLPAENPSLPGESGPAHRTTVVFPEGGAALRSWLPAMLPVEIPVEGSFPAGLTYPEDRSSGTDFRRRSRSITQGKFAGESVQAVSAEASPEYRLTRAEVSQLIDDRLDALRIYVLESDITRAQQAVKTVVELASF